MQSWSIVPSLRVACKLDQDARGAGKLYHGSARLYGFVPTNFQGRSAVPTQPALTSRIEGKNNSLRTKLERSLAINFVHRDVTTLLQPSGTTGQLCICRLDPSISVLLQHMWRVPTAGFCLTHVPISNAGGMDFGVHCMSQKEGNILIQSVQPFPASSKAGEGRGIFVRGQT